MIRLLTYLFVLSVITSACTQTSSIIRVKAGQTPHVVLLETSVPRYGTNSRMLDDEDGELKGHVGDTLPYIAYLYQTSSSDVEEWFYYTVTPTDTVWLGPDVRSTIDDRIYTNGRKVVIPVAQAPAAWNRAAAWLIKNAQTAMWVENDSVLQTHYPISGGKSSYIITKTIRGDSAIIAVDCTYKKSTSMNSYSDPCSSQQLRALRFIYGWQ